jgi:hypothetical protein
MNHLLIAGVPATGKSWLGRWLSETQGYRHIDAERDGGIDFDRLRVHEVWDQLIATGQAHTFVAALEKLGKPVVLDWGFPVSCLYVARSLQSQGFVTWWLHGDREQARQAFLARGGIDVLCFDHQMDDIEREWPAIRGVFGMRIVEGLRPNGSQRNPGEIWADISAGG